MVANYMHLLCICCNQKRCHSKKCLYCNAKFSWIPPTQFTTPIAPNRPWFIEQITTFPWIYSAVFWQSGSAQWHNFPPFKILLKGMTWNFLRKGRLELKLVFQYYKNTMINYDTCLLQWAKFTSCTVVTSNPSGLDFFPTTHMKSRFNTYAYIEISMAVFTKLCSIMYYWLQISNYIYMSLCVYIFQRLSYHCPMSMSLSIIYLRNIAIIYKIINLCACPEYSGVHWCDYHTCTNVSTLRCFRVYYKL